ncbi:putative mosc domain protein [Phaeomoniella chlamydospora]|uniref:Putative mosc domain protein n=1 Tax=Phaeomoniella chlamydospora TaxID=158046 RepID=A0A0G2GKX5_PHACM|nr:putative mosc domain protein [Phaeomoniella chlamydospora]
MLSNLLKSCLSYISLSVILNAISLLAVSLITSVAHVRLRERSHSTRPPRGFVKLGLGGPSNLEDENDPKYRSWQTSNEQANGNVKALYIHPIKSCAAVELDEAGVCPSGLVWDREFSFAELLIPETRPDASEEEKQPVWRFRTQRTPGYENLALVRPELWFPRHKIGASPDEKSRAVMIVKYPLVFTGPLQRIYQLLQSAFLLPRERSFSVPLDTPEKEQFATKDVVIWKDTPRWFDYGQYLPSDLASFVGAENPFSLFRTDPSRYREVFRCAPRKEQLGYQPVVGFQDAYPLHLLSVASVQDIGEKVKHAIPNFTARRFRANLIVVGGKEYDEDDWKRIQIGEVEYYCACHTVRCKLPNVDPDTAVRDRFEPDRTLKKFRRIDAGDPTNACLGMQLVPVQQHGKIRVGDDVRVLERGEHLYIKQ